jgi:predicted metal-dependent enzyme (double-stranded beta helix superfamily)
MEALYHVGMSSLLSQSHAGRQVNLESNPDADLPFSLLERVVPGLPAELEAACLSEPDLVPYRMRQAIGQQLGRRAAVDLTAAILALPRSTQSYTRHILHADPLGRFTVVGLVWGSQQCSPIHAHYAWCAYRILAGELTEGFYQWDSSQRHAYLLSQFTREPGYSACGHAGLEFIHRLGNRATEPAVSIHVYGMDVGRIGTHVNRVLASAQTLN